ncbi:MAG: penicillin-binding protein 2 [Chitinophagaceae bacterium]|nr:penicillin-binding protein 2 [Rubrivivax sp.]
MSRGGSSSRSVRGGVSGSVRSVNYATSPLLASKTPPWRSRFVVLLVGAAFALLLGRAVYVQIIATDFYQAQGEKRFVLKQPLPASRGRILDRHGQVLATSVALPSIQVDTKTFAADVDERQSLARLLGLRNAELADKLEGASGTVTLRRLVEEPVWQQIRALKLAGVHSVREFKRRYPEGEAAAHVVGFTHEDIRLQEGIERAFEARLVGHHGQRTLVRDRLGRAVEDIGDQADPVHGGDVTLSIDAKVQFFAWQQVRDAVHTYGASAGSVVVLDLKTGEILALANVPTFDPNNRQNLKGEKVRNRALTDIFEPGSTMKPFTIAQALESKRVTPNTLVDTGAGRLTMQGATITDTHPNGVLTVAGVIQKSSNVGAVKIGMPIPERELWEMYTQIGLGQKPRIDFPGAVTGRLRPHKSWKPIEKATMTYGYGLSASLLQMARAYTVFGTDGELLPLTIQRHDAPVSGSRVFSPETVRQVREMLRLAAGPGGTTQKAQPIGYSVGGKTGTARKHRGNGKGYGTKYCSWFIGLAPIHDPRIVVAVMVDEPSKGVYYGGDVAAPVFNQVVQQTLRMLKVAPDLDLAPSAHPGNPANPARPAKEQI